MKLTSTISSISFLSSVMLEETLEHRFFTLLALFEVIIYFLPDVIPVDTAAGLISYFSTETLIASTTSLKS